MRFSTDRDFLSIPSRTFGTGSPYSIAFWARVDDASRPWNMALGNQGNTNFFIAANGGSDNLRWRSNANASGTRTVDFPSGVNDTSWHHYVITAGASNNLSLYLDGTLVSSQSNVQTGFIIDTIGEAYTSSSDFDFEGEIDEVWIFDEALDAAAIEGLHSTNDHDADSTDKDLSVTKIYAILVGGQSNADGRAAPGDLPTTPDNLQQAQTRVPYFYKIEGAGTAYTFLQPGLTETGGFGPDITLGYHLEKLYRGEPNTRIAILKYANGGTSLAVQWKGGGDGSTTGDGPEYLTFQQTINSGLVALANNFPNATIETAGMLWIQGESDGGNATDSAAYEANLTQFITDIRATFDPELPFYISRLASTQTAINASLLATIRAAQEAVANADPRNIMIDTDSFGIKDDNLHFDSDGQQAIGRITASEVAYSIWVRENFTPSQISAGSANRSNDPDKDGKTNEEEFGALTDPQNASSQFTCWIGQAAETSTTISYQSSVLRTYAVEKLNLNTLSWDQILTPEPGTGEVLSRPVPFTTPTGIFRISSELP